MSKLQFRVKLHKNISPTTMSLFRKPKKIHRRVFSSAMDDEDDANADARDTAASENVEQNADELIAPPPPQISSKSDKKKNKESKSKSSTSSSSSSKIALGCPGDAGKTKSLLSFADEGM